MNSLKLIVFLRNICYLQNQILGRFSLILENTIIYQFSRLDAANPFVRNSSLRITPMNTKKKLIVKNGGHSLIDIDQSSIRTKLRHKIPSNLESNIRSNNEEVSMQSKIVTSASK